MGLADLTDRRAVLRAIDEFNELGRRGFLKKYGYRRARSYFLLRRGARYDSKAIAGAAHGYQHPDRGPLRADKFSGGEKTVAKRLRELGFEVTTVGCRPREPRAWALCANPKRYRIRAALEYLDVDYWRTGRSDVRGGDQVIVWQTRDREGRRGVVGFGQVLADPEVCRDDSNPFWVDPEDGRKRAARFPVQYFSAPKLPLWVDNAAYSESLLELSVSQAQGGTVFRVTADQWGRIVELAGASLSVREVEQEAMDWLRHGTRRSIGQGWGLDAPERKAVENRAMLLGRRFFQDDWPEVRNVSATASFDLLCRRGEEELRVEIKGTTGSGEKVILTKNEIEQAAKPGYALFVVTGIELDRAEPSGPKARGGVCGCFSPWDQDRHRLEPIAFSCELDWSAADSVEPRRKL